MQNSNEKPQITIQIVHAALIWVTLATFEIIAGFYLRLAEKSDWYYPLALGLTTVLFGSSLFFGKQAIVNDIQEICFYDVLVQILGYMLYTPGHKSEIYLALAQVVIILKLMRLAWPFFSPKFMLPSYWPSFGMIGLLRAWRSGKPLMPYTPAQKRKFYLILACTLPIGYLIQLVWLKFNTPLPPIIVFGAALWGGKRLIATLEAREEEHRQTERDLGAAKGREQAKQEYIAELTTLNAQLAQKNTELEIAYQERAAMSQKLAARNDKLADDAHDVKHGLVPMAFKVHDLATHATTQAQRDAALWLQEEIKATSSRIGRIIHEAKISNPLPPLTTRQTLPLHLLCAYFFTRYNAQACQRDITLLCTHHANLAAISINEEIFKRVMANLITNAIAHTAPEGHIRVRFFSAPGCCYVHVLDNGPGMPDLNSRDRSANFTNLIERLEQKQFLRYQAAPQAPEAQPGEGHGIGLINVGRLCNELGIAITARSIVGRGTAFRLKLPLAH